MRKLDKYDPIRRLTQKDRDEILEFALKRSKEMLEEPEEDLIDYWENKNEQRE